MNIYLESLKSFVWQWDTRQRVVLEGYPTGTVVHYANCKTQDAPVVETRQEGDLLVADIPPELMQEPHDITIYACDANGTQHCHYIHVFARPKPESYVYEPVEILRYETLSKRIRKLEEQPGEAVTEHNTSSEAHSDMRLELRTLKALTDIMISAKDIVDNLVTDDHSKPLSAAQGVALNRSLAALASIVDDLNGSLAGYALAESVPTKISQLQNDTGYLTEHQDISGKADKTGLDFKLGMDNLMHLFVDGKPVGDGMRKVGFATINPIFEYDENGIPLGGPIRYESCAINFVDELAKLPGNVTIYY